jgi:hypothetical protein
VDTRASSWGTIFVGSDGIWKFASASTFCGSMSISGAMSRPASTRPPSFTKLVNSCGVRMPIGRSSLSGSYGQVGGEVVPGHGWKSFWV